MEYSYSAGKAWLKGHAVTKTEGITIDASKILADSDGQKIVRSGTCLGKITATGLARPVTRTSLAADASAETTLSVADASPFVVGDSISVGGAAATTITDIDYDNNTITVADAQTASTGDAVVGQDGSATCIGIAWDTANVTAENKAVAILVHGHVEKDSLYFYDAQVESDLPLVIFE